MAKRTIDLTTDIKQEARLTADPRPRRLTVRRVQGRWRLDALGRWWTPGELLALAAGAVVIAGALWAWLAGR